jgi:hypothetical protein
LAHRIRCVSTDPTTPNDSILSAAKLHAITPISVASKERHAGKMRGPNSAKSPGPICFDLSSTACWPPSPILVIESPTMEKYLVTRRTQFPTCDECRRLRVRCDAPGRTDYSGPVHRLPSPNG